MFNFWRINKNVKPQKEYPIKGDLTLKSIKEVLGDSSDVMVKQVYINNDKKFDVYAIGIDGMVDSDIIDGYILRPLATQSIISTVKSEKELFELVEAGILYHNDQETQDSLTDAINKILSGQTIILFNSIKKAVAFDAKQFDKRGIQAPDNESVLKGAKDAFIENIRTNTSLIRRKLKTPELRFKEIIVGKKSRTPVSVVYMEGVTDEDILQNVIDKISAIDADNLISAGIFEENIRDNKHSIFPQVLYTERVDKFCANLVDGKVGILIDGLPLAYIVPAVLAMFFQAPEDYSNNYLISSLIRFLRYLAAAITLILPGFYVAVITFHQEMVPTDLLMSIIKSKAGVPFSAVFEVFIMLIAFEILLEASLRLPKTIGATISIIGGLVIGDAAVNAKFISPAIVVIIAISGICGFMIPNQSLSNTFRVCRLILFIFSAAAGLFGLSMGITMIIYYICKIESFGVPYVVPYAANESKNLLKDTVVRSLNNNIVGGNNGE